MERKKTSDTKALARSFKCHGIVLDSTKQEKKRNGICEKVKNKRNGTALTRNEKEQENRIQTETGTVTSI